MIATVMLQLKELTRLTRLKTDNYHSCIVVAEDSTSEDPNKWVMIINHQLLTHYKAANSKFRDQVQTFTKQELNPETI